MWTGRCITIGEIVSTPGLSVRRRAAREVVLVSGLLLPMTIAFGAAFPFAVALASGRDETVTEHLGLIYAINTLGAILGSLLAGFVLVPAIGLHMTIRVVAAIGVVAALAILVRAARGRGRLIGFGLAAAVSSQSPLVPQWDRSLLSSGAYKYAPAMRGSN